MPEHQFAAAIEQALAEPGTIGVGYNTIRFDDEVTRFLFWRNLIDPYAREWQNDCGRWDLLDVVRTTYALRPDGIDWPTHEDGRPSFRLEAPDRRQRHLAHEAAHDALSDVRATHRAGAPDPRAPAAAVRFLLRAAQEGPRVRRNRPARRPRPFLHVSGMFPAERGCLARDVAAGAASDQQE